MVKLHPIIPIILSKKRLKEMQKAFKDADKNGLSVLQLEDDIDWAAVDVKRDPEYYWNLD